MNKFRGWPILGQIAKIIDHLSSMGKRKVIIDTDPGIDDMQAILMALAAKDIKVVAFTTVAGNGSVDRVFQNTKNILKFCGRYDIPVYRGTEVSMTAKTVQTDCFFGKDSLGDINLENVHYHTDNSKSSAEAINYFTKMYPGEITLVALGPLTNVAAAYMVDNKLPERLDGLFVMGGDRREEHGGNVTPYAEFNAWCDPIAWSVVMNYFRLCAGKKIIVLDFEFCQKFPISVDYLEEYYKSVEKFPKSLPAKLVFKTYSHMSKKFTEEGMVVPDNLLTYIALYPEVKFESKCCKLKSITLDGEKIGQTVFEECVDGNILLVESFDIEGFKNVLMDSLEC